MQPQQNTPMILQAACEETKGRTHQSFCLLFPTHTMGLLALADCAGSFAEAGDLACLLALQTLLDQVAPMLLDTTLMNDDAYFVLLKDGAQQVHKALCLAPDDYGPCSLTAALLVKTNAYIVHAGTNRLYLAYPPLPLYQVTRDDYFVHSDNNHSGILRMFGVPFKYQDDATLDAMRLSLFPGDTLLLGTGSLWRTIPESTCDAALRQFFGDPMQICHQLITSAVNSNQEKSQFFHLIVIGTKATDTETAAQSQHMQVIHMPEQLVLPKALQERQK